MLLQLLNANFNMNESINPSQVSDNVRAALTAAFPSVDATSVEWSWEVPNKIIEAEFVLDGVEHEVEITVTGHLLLTEKALPIDVVPVNVLEAVKAKYPELTASDAELVIWSSGEVFYELNLNNAEGEKVKEVHVSAEGVLTAEGEDM